MAIRPTTIWREGIEEEVRLVAAGLLEDDFAVTAKLHPPDLLSRMDEIFDAFEREIGGRSHAPDEEVIADVRRVVLALNALDEDYDGDAIATEERDMICAYIDEVVTEAGVDLEALCTRQGMPRDELTDPWRTW